MRVASQHRRTASRPRRENAPIRRGPKPPSLPDPLFALAATAWGMALVLGIALLGGNSAVVGEAGTTLAQIFTAALGTAGLCLVLLGVTLLGDDRNRADHYVIPISAGLAAGAIEALLVMTTATTLVPLPLLLLTFALRPVRHTLARLAGVGGRQ